MGGVLKGNLREHIRIAVFLLGAAVLPTVLHAQSITAGALQGSVHSGGEPVPGAAITLEDAGGNTLQELIGTDAGRFAVPILQPGTYSILVEVEGYQPVRVRGIVVAAGRTTTLGVELVERPPPITSVTELSQTGVMTGPLGRIVLEQEFRTFDFPGDASSFSRGTSVVAPPALGHSGFAVMASGLPEGMTRFFVDGIPELLVRHPGLVGDPALTAGFPRVAIGQGQVAGSALDAEWRGAPGSVLTYASRSGGNRLAFRPYLEGSSARLGGNRELNPADSSTTSIRGGFSASGAIKPDTARFFVGGDFQSLETPSTFSWEPDAATRQGAPVSLREAIPAIAQERHATALGSPGSPVVRSWKGGSGLGRVDWRVGRTSSLMARIGFSSWEEKNPLIGSDVGNDAGTSLSARDITAGVAFTTTGRVSNEFRAGLSLARRDWRSSGLPATRLVAEAVRFGGHAALPGLFEIQLLTFEDAIQYQSGPHLIKGGISIDYTNYRQQYRYGAAGIFLFPDLDHFEAGTGDYFRIDATNPEVQVGVPEIGLFIQDTWQLSPGLDVLLGLRYETQVLPRNRIGPNAAWFTRTGIVSDSAPFDRRGIQPRIGFVHSPGDRGDFVIQGGVGVYAGHLDLATFAEAVHHSGNNGRVFRGTGNLGSWPSPGTTAVGGPVTRLTMFSETRKYRAPRTLKADLAITRSLAGGLTLQLSGGYHHTDYLLRRADLNRSQLFGEAQDGRPVWGLLHQQGGLVSVRPGTSRAFDDFDLVSLLASTGFSDYYELTASLSRPVGRSFRLLADYTFSRTRDNVVGLLAPDPADQFSPFPDGIEGLDWDEGTSDLDIPHRAAIALEFSGGSLPVRVGVRGRMRSGLPFTPGFRSGVDVNGDLGGTNDPAPAEAVVNPGGGGVVASCTTASVGGFAARNSCRERSAASVDLRLGL